MKSIWSKKNVFNDLKKFRYEVSMARKERFQVEMKNMLLGACVLTRYNNRLYRVDDIDFSINPKCTFDRRDEKVSYHEYYKTQYNLEIRDLSQPMLISKFKKKQSGAEVGKCKHSIIFFSPSF
jgi:hypothetical protein